MTRLLAVPLALFLCSCSSSSKVLTREIQSDKVKQSFLSHPQDRNKKIEFYWAKPDGEGPWPVIVYIHGHQEPERPGGKDMADWGVLERNAQSGIVSVSISQPGYGQSDGPPDYSGPFTQEAVITVLNAITSWNFVDVKRIALYGISRGAIVASMIETKYPSLAAAVLVVGVYDLEKTYLKLVRESQKSELAKGISENIKAETGATKKAFLDRSALLNSNKIKTPTLILAGALDERSDAADSERLAAMIRKNGTFAKAVIYKEHGHSIPIAKRNIEIEPFWEQYLHLPAKDASK